MTHKPLKTTLTIVCFCINLGFVSSIYATPIPGVISNAPLFTASGTGNSAVPNIVFQFDDSGSMDWDILTKKYWAYCLYDPATFSGCSYTSLQTDGNFNNSNKNMTDITTSIFSTLNIADWRVRSSAMNTLYYNPYVTYMPWKNKTGDGTYMANATFTAVKDDPNASGTTNLSTNGFIFDVAIDSHGYSGTKPAVTTTNAISVKKVGITTTTTVNKNQVVNRTVGANNMIDLWDEHYRYQMTSSDFTRSAITYNPAISGATSTTQGAGTPNITITNTNTLSLGETITGPVSLSGGFNGRTIDQEKINIANWYQYYRRRINVAKGALGSVIVDNPNYRYGFNTIWNEVFIPVPASGTTSFAAQNTSILTALYALAANNSTPLPNALDRIGQYYKHNALPPIGSTTSPSVTYDNPITYECQQNFAVMLTDGYWNENLSNSAVANTDGDGVSSTLADVASYYYKNDLDNNGSNNSVPKNLSIVPTDEANWQHMITYTVAFGLEGKLVAGANGWPTATSICTTPTPATMESCNWGNPSGGSDIPEKIDDLWHAAYNSRGLYISADSPEAISNGFKTILDNISQRNYKGSAASVSFNTSTLNAVSSVYMGQFSKPTDSPWIGDVIGYAAYPAVPGTYDGTLYTTAISPIVSSKLGQISSTPKWQAATVLQAKANPVCSTTTPFVCGDVTSVTNPPDRHIFTYNTDSSKAVPFQWAQLTNAQRNDLGTSTSGAISAGTATSPDLTALARLAYLRGDTRNEIGKTGAIYNFKSRDFKITSTATPPVVTTVPRLLGDIVHSDPIYVGKPSGNWPSAYPFPTGAYNTTTGTGSYANFKKYLSATGTQRPEIIYSGANDGMLHGFKSTDGSEAMAYIPNTVYSSAKADIGLHYLTSTSYTHRYYVDMPSVVTDAYIDTGSVVGIGAGRRWHSVLLGGEMAGGRGIFALDVTDPTIYNIENATNAAKLALWEFDSTDDASMGYSFAVPSLIMTNSTDATKRWAVVLGNGYNSSDNGQAALFILFVEGGLDGTWTLGSDYLKIYAPISTDTIVSSDCTNTSSSCNGLSTPQPYSSKQNGVTDRVYAGDLKGNLWAFDLSSADFTNWRVASCPAATTNANASCTTANKKPLFTATYHVASTAGGVPAQQNSSSPKPQPITSRPVVARNTNVLTGAFPNTLVMFGTGQYITDSDPTNTDVQTFYAVWDHGFYNMTPANLVQQTFVTNTIYNGGVDVTANQRVLSKNPVNYVQAALGTTATTLNNPPQGWLINLPTSKERQIVDPDVFLDRYLSFNTWIPGSTSTVVTNTVCQTGGSAAGTGYLMILDLFTGGAPTSSIVDINKSGTVNSGDLLASTQTTTTTTTYAVSAGSLFTGGLPASSSFAYGNQYTAGTDSGSLTVTDIDIASPIKRVSWQELRN